MSLPLIAADDWGLSPGINEGILDLASRGIVRRVSILASASFVGHGLSELKTIKTLTLGLHFSLTFGKTRLGARIRILSRDGQLYLSPVRIAFLYFLAAPRRRKQLAKEANLLVREQFGNLRNYGITPNYFDGHHHIHQIPGIMESLLPVLRELGITQVRASWDSARLLSRVSPAVMLALIARQRWRRWGLTSLPFVYPTARNYRDERVLRSIVERKGGYEMVVHPAAHDDVSELGILDHYSGDRVREYHALSSLEPLFSHEKGEL